MVGSHYNTNTHISLIHTSYLSQAVPVEKNSAILRNFRLDAKLFILVEKLSFLVGIGRFWMKYSLCGKTEPIFLSVVTTPWHLSVFHHSEMKNWQMSCMHWWPGGKSCSIFQLVGQMAVIISMSHSPEIQLGTISQNLKSVKTCQQNIQVSIIQLESMTNVNSEKYCNLKTLPTHWKLRGVTAIAPKNDVCKTNGRVA